MNSPDKLASDMDNKDFQGAISNPDDLLDVTFERRMIKNEFKSEQEGKTVVEERDFIIIQSPGDTLNVIDTYATESYKRRFRKQWNSYIKNNHLEQEGTLLSEWGIPSTEHQETLARAKFKTVEQFAAAPFNIVQKMGMGFIELQDMAKKFVAAPQSRAPSRLEALEKSNKELQEKLNALLAKNDRKAG